MQPDSLSEINKLGSRLSILLHCPIRFPAFDKNIFACEHGMPIPLYRLLGNNDWSSIKKEHDEWMSNTR